MNRRKALQSIITTGFVALSGCAGSQTETSTPTSTPNSELDFEIEWEYSELDGYVITYELLNGAFYIRDSGDNLQKINTSTGDREWYVSNLPSGNSLLDASDHIISVDDENWLSVASYSQDGEVAFNVDLTEYDIYQQPTIGTRAVGSQSGLYVTGLLQTDNTPACYTQKIDPETGSSLGNYRWHTSGKSETIPGESKGIIVGGSGYFPSYIERISPEGRSQWAVNLDFDDSSHIRRIHISGNLVFADYVTSEKSGVVAIDLDGNQRWSYEQRGSPTQNYDILYSSIVTNEHIITPYIEDRQESSRLTTVILKKETGDEVVKKEISTPSGEYPSQIVGRAHIGDKIIFGFRTADDVTSILFQSMSIPDMRDTGTVRLPVDPSGVMARISEGAMLCVNKNGMTKVSTTSN